MEMTAQPQQELTFKDVWAMFQETDKQIKETAQQMKETDKQIKETAQQMKETDKQLKETGQLIRETRESQKEADRQFQASKAEYDRQFQASKAEYDRRQEKLDAQIKELSANLGGLGNSLGDMAEGLMASDLEDTFKALNLDFDQFTGNYKLKESKTGRTLTEVDMLLINGTIAMAVEVKTTMTRGDVDKHIEQMEILRNKSNSLFANRKLYGAMAGIKISKYARHYAIAQGFYIIELSGDTIKVDMPEGFTPKTW